MSKFFVDANLPFKLKTWQRDDFEFVVLINDEWTDGEIWNYAIENDLIIITKDTDFSHRTMVSNESPGVSILKWEM